MNSRKKFGGKWSDKKLEALQAYLTAYTTALKKTPFKLIYIDAFAGAGKHTDEDEENSSYRHGSPLIALETKPSFNTYIFIDKDPKALESLKSQINAEPQYESKEIHYFCQDANEKLQELCQKDWRASRAVAFLDPFALSLNWETIQAIARTKAIDLWLLFPAMAVNRMLTRSGKMDETWRAKLTCLFGCDDWESFFYQETQPDLFGETQTFKVPDIFDKLTKYVTFRLNKEFEKTISEPLILRNSTGSPMFLLCFASGNKRGAPIALRIAKHIINKQT